MTWGRSGTGRALWGRDDAVDASAQSQFETLLNDPTLKRLHIVELHPWDPDGAAEVERFYLDDDWDGDRGDIPLRVEEALSVNARVFATTGTAGTSGPSSFGTITLHGHTEEGVDTDDLEELTSFHWGGRLVRVLMGGENDAFSNFQPVFSGRSSELLWDKQSYRIGIADPSLRMRELLLDESYAGTGGLEGDEEQEGRKKPGGYGPVYQARPILVDRVNQVYQVHHGQIHAIGIPQTPQGDLGGVFDQGQALRYRGDVADVYTPGFALDPGDWISCLALGILRLEAPPAGVLTVEFMGSKTGGVYVDQPHTIAERMLRDRLGFTDADIDGQSMNQLSLDLGGLPNLGKVGVYITGAENPTVQTVVDALLRSVFAFWTYDRLGRFFAAELRFRNPVVTITDDRVVSIARVRTDPVQYRRTMGYGRSYTVMDESDLGILDDPEDVDPAFVAEEFRRVFLPATTPEQDAILAIHPDAIEVDVDTLVESKLDADALIADQWSLVSVARDRYDVVVDRHQFTLKPGDTIRLDYPHWGLSGGRNMLILGLGESTTLQHTTLRLWG